MTKLITATAVPASLLELEETIKRAIRVMRSECGESQAIVNNVDTMFAELHEALALQPRYVATSAVPQSLLDMEFRLKDAMETLVVKVSRSNKTDFIKLKTDVYSLYHELNDVVDLRVQDLQPQDLMGYPQAEDMAKVVSIQLQCTRLTGAGVEHVPFVKCTELATHWSLYTRAATGLVEWVEDFHIDAKSSGRAYSNAIHAAAKLSMQHQAFIEQVQ